MQLSKPGDYFFSPTGASSPKAPNATWRLELSPNGENKQSKGTVAIYVYLSSAEVGAARRRHCDGTNYDSHN